MGHNDLDPAAVARLDDVALVAGLHRLVQQDRALTARLLVHLGEVDARGLYREQAFSSMFEYAVEALHMSPAEAYVRLRAAKVARDFPPVLQMLEKNELHLTAIKLLAPHLTQANHADVLSRARAKSKREVELLVAELAPKPDVPSVVRKLPGARPSARVVPQPPVEPAPSSHEARELRLEAPVQVTTPLSPGRYKVQFTATQVLHDKLQQLKDLMRHQVPDGDLCVIFERAADLLIEQQIKRRFAQTEKPRSSATDAGRKAAPWSRYNPRAVVREVYARDGGQCTFVSPDRRRCRARDHLELHHEDPFALGGPPTVENLRLLCHTHNALLAERDFGRAYIEGKRMSGARNRTNRDPSRVRATPSISDRQPSESSARSNMLPSRTPRHADTNTSVHSRRNQSSTVKQAEFTQLYPAPTDKHLSAQREATCSSTSRTQSPTQTFRSSRAGATHEQ